ncbi:MAG: hypothetical protein AAB428_02980 [Patescibacteria group bacterium]
MLHHLRKLREKPIHIRRVILTVSTFVITGVIFLIWLSYWVGSLGKISERGQTSATAAAINGQAPSSLVKENWSGLEDAFFSGLSEIKNQFRF